MAKKRRRGTGNIITMRRLRGLGRLNNPSSFMGSALPPLLGVGLTALTTVATRYWAKPSEGETPKALFKWAPGIGLAVGSVFSLGLYYLGGAPAAISGFTGSLATSGGLMLHDHIVKNNIGEFSLALPASVAGNGGGDLEGYRRRMAGMGVVVPERRLAGGQTRGIVYEDAASRDPRRRYGATGSYGETVNVPGNVSGLSPSAFGTPGYGASA